MELFHRDQESIWHPFTSLQAPPPIPVVGAEGVWLHTADGRKILDAVSSWWVNLYGHAHPVIAEAIAKQAKSLEHVIFAGFTHEPAVLVAEKLLKLCGSQFSKVFFSDNGSTAVEVALKLAIQYWVNKGEGNRNKILALEGAYHGDTFGAMSAGERNLFNKPFQPYLFDVAFVPFPDDVEKSVAVFEQYCQQEDVAAFIYEPLVQGTSGMRIYSPDFLEKAFPIAEKYGVIMIADEVFTGMGRTGRNFASEYVSQRPDLMCVSKGITGGFLPLGLTVVCKKITEVFDHSDISKTFYHGHSYTGNPICCAAANASLDLLVSELMQQNISRIEKKHSSFVAQIKDHPKVLRVESLGTILSIEIGTTCGQGYTSTLRQYLYDFFINEGVLLRPLGNIVYLVPPYVIKDEELDLIYQKIQLILHKLPSEN